MQTRKECIWVIEIISLNSILWRLALLGKRVDVYSSLDYMSTASYNLCLCIRRVEKWIL